MCARFLEPVGFDRDIYYVYSAIGKNCRILSRPKEFFISKDFARVSRSVSFSALRYNWNASQTFHLLWTSYIYCRRYVYCRYVRLLCLLFQV